MKFTTVDVSVVVCTRDRPDDLRRCLASVRMLDPAPLEVVVVDQSSSTNEPEGMTGLIWLRTDEAGLSRARNRGLAAARAPVVAFIDDDCVVPPGWAGDVAEVFARRPEAALVFGEVRRANPSPDEYVPTYLIAEEHVLRGRAAAARAHGIGAAMYLRASAADTIGPFDECLGAGGRFRSSEDWDFTFRALAQGFEVVETPAIAVRHFGGRPYAGGSAASMLRWNAFSHGALHAKFARKLDPVAAILILAELGTLVGNVRPLGAIRGRPTNLARLYMYVRGFAAGLRTPLSKTENLFSAA